mmetsp:Transcript_12663/g.19181  ORF Transcript_12663/g.19181 Transcript_12663/m.19181 type:complete len:154 (-) Transcript_12663:246-707(-)
MIAEWIYYNRYCGRTRIARIYDCIHLFSFYLDIRFLLFEDRVKAEHNTNYFLNQVREYMNDDQKFADFQQEYVKFKRCTDGYEIGRITIVCGQRRDLFDSTSEWTVNKDYWDSLSVRFSDSTPSKRAFIEFGTKMCLFSTGIESVEQAVVALR